MCPRLLLVPGVRSLGRGGDGDAGAQAPRSSPLPSGELAPVTRATLPERENWSSVVLRPFEPWATRGIPPVAATRGAFNGNAVRREGRMLRQAVVWPMG